MLKFLREHQVADAFKVARRKDKQARIAVSFWGEGAAKKLGLRKGADVEILCNLDHVGCNPRAIKELRDLGLKVKSHPRLHGKVYATPGMAIVGSSNASTNGLTVEGNEAIGWKEANVQSDDAGFVADAIGFFDELWRDKEARTVRQSDINAALARRASVPRGLLDPPRANTLVAACREDPEAFANVIVVAYDQGLGLQAKRDYVTFKEQAVEPEPGTKQPNFERSWAYQTDRIPKGTWVVDLDCKSGRKPAKVWGCSKASGYVIRPEGEELVTVTLRGPVTIGGRRYPLPPAERAFLEAAGRKILKARGDEHITLERAIRIADRVARSTR